jgi:hypothetical protein
MCRILCRQPWAFLVFLRRNRVLSILVEESQELVRASGLPKGALVEVESDHRLADPEPLEALARAVDER